MLTLYYPGAYLTYFCTCLDIAGTFFLIVSLGALLVVLLVLTLEYPSAYQWYCCAYLAIAGHDWTDLAILFYCFSLCFIGGFAGAHFGISWRVSKVFLHMP